MHLYLCIVFNCVPGNNIIMGFCGVMAAGLGIVASLGLVSACGMNFVSIVGNMPFLILGKFICLITHQLNITFTL